jgi:hypothetical protein
MSGILTLAVACVGGRYLTQEYRFVLEVRADSTLGELASCILRTLAFDSEHLSEFYLANGPYGGRKVTVHVPDGIGGSDGRATPFLAAAITVAM